VEAPVPISDLVANLRAAREVAAQCKASHPELRENYLTRLAEAIVSARCPFLDAPRMAHEKAKRVAQEIVGTCIGKLRKSYNPKH
jgi:hypothetical protein